MKILVTGAAGFIGSGIAKRLAETDHDVILTDIRMPDDLYGHAYTYADLTDKSTVDALPDVDIVYHLCAYNNTTHFYERPYSVLDATLTPTIYLLDRYKNVKKFIYASSSEIYAGAVQLGLVSIPTNETNIGVINDLENPRWSYAGSKMMGEIAVKAANVEFGTEYLIVRYHNVYGKNQVAHFIPEYAERVKAGDNILYGADQTRAFIYIDDAADLTVKIAENTNNTVVHIGNPIETKISEVAQIIRNIIKVNAEPEYKSAPAGSVDRRCADVSKMISIVGEYNFTELEEGLRKTLL